MGDVALGPAFWALTVLGLAGAVAYGTYFLDRPRTFLRALVKTLFMAAFAGALISAGTPFPLVAAIVLSAAGDFCLAFDKNWVLPFGILSFLLAQLLYFVMFGAVWFFSGDNSPLLPRYIAMGVVAAALIAFLVWFWRGDDFERAPILNWLTVTMLVATGALLPFLLFGSIMLLSMSGETRSEANDAPLYAVILAFIPVLALVAIPVLALALAILRRGLGAVRLGAMVYAGAIVGMVFAAMWLPWAGWPASVGALLFLVSDFVLAAELFRLPADAPVRSITAPVVWWTYAAAQVLIIWGVINLVQAGG